MQQPMDRNEFQAEIYDVVREIPAGKVVTYGLLARLVHAPQSARRAGRALRDAPADAGLPCHRVVNAQGRLAPCWPGQRRLLEAEGVPFRRNGCVDLKRCLWSVAGELR